MIFDKKSGPGIYELQKPVIKKFKKKSFLKIYR